MIEVRAVTKRYEASGPGSATVNALNGVDLAIAPGESVALMGASGSGKSTLLHLLGGLDQPTSGEVVVAGEHLEKLDDPTLSRFRRDKLGFVFQFFHLLNTFTVQENVTLQGRMSGLSEDELQKRSEALLKRVGLFDRRFDLPDALSGGQRQRVALARALVTRPMLLLADEPTGNLDSATSVEVLKLLSELVREHNATLVMATHSPDAAAIASRIVRLKDGKIE